jgi:hypothetical protein
VSLATLEILPSQHLSSQLVFSFKSSFQWTFGIYEVLLLKIELSLGWTAKARMLNDSLRVDTRLRLLS